jgi:hypothetical protein
MAPSVARESTLHCKLDSPLYWAVVRSIFWVGGKWIMEIPVTLIDQTGPVLNECKRLIATVRMTNFIFWVSLRTRE